MLPHAFRALFVGGLLIGLTTGVGCTSKDEPTPGTGGSTTSGGTGGNGGTPGTGGTGGIGGTPGAGTGGATGGAPVGGSAGTPSAGAGQGGATAGTPAAGGVGGSAGTPSAGVGGTPGAGSGGTAGDTAGSAGSAGAAGGGTGGAPATLVEPILRNGNYVLEFGNLYFEVAPAGARVMDVHLMGGMNLLTGSAVNSTNFGSTFWTSPQGDWTAGTDDWPPPAEVDTAAYTATVASPSVTFVGPSSAAIGASITKKFTADLVNYRVNAEYTIIATAAGKSFAPWEVTRVAQRGITFWPTGGAPTGTAMPPTTTGAGCTWHQAPSAPPGTDQKLFADGTGGWLAYVDGDTLIVKKFPDIMASQAAPAEAEIELYVSGTSPYMELEQQGAYGALAMGASVSWTVTWYVVKLPAGLTPSVGSQPLVDYVQSLIQ